MLWRATDRASRWNCPKSESDQRRPRYEEMRRRPHHSLLKTVVRATRVGRFLPPLVLVRRHARLRVARRHEPQSRAATHRARRRLAAYAQKENTRERSAQHASRSHLGECWPLSARRREKQRIECAAANRRRPRPRDRASRRPPRPAPRPARRSRLRGARTPAPTRSTPQRAESRGTCDARKSNITWRVFRRPAL